MLVGVVAFTLLFPVIHAIAVPEQIGAPEMLPNVPDGTYRVYVVDWGYHTAIVAPQPAGWMLGPPGEEQAPLLERTFRHASGGGRVAPYSTHAGYAGRFFPAYGQYLWTRNCNWWTAERLRSVGLAKSGAGVVLSGQVRGGLREFRP